MRFYILAAVFLLSVWGPSTAHAQDRLAERRAHLEMLASDDPLTVEFAVEEGMQSDDQVIVRESLRKALGSKDNDLTAQAFVYLFNSGQIMILELDNENALRADAKAVAADILPGKMYLYDKSKKLQISGGRLLYDSPATDAHFDCRFIGQGMTCVSNRWKLSFSMIDEDSVSGTISGKWRNQEFNFSIRADLY